MSGAFSNNIRVEDVFKMSPKFGTATLTFDQIFFVKLFIRYK